VSGNGRRRSPRSILISYRRSDAKAIVGRIHDRLVARYGAGAVFLDIDDIPYGRDFRSHIQATLAQCGVVVAVVGPGWRAAAGDGVRIMDADDPVRLEVELTLAAGVPVVPVLVDGATMPASTELPASIERFSYLNAVTVDSGVDFHHHVDRLVAALDDMLGIDAPAAPRARLIDALRGPYALVVAGGAALPIGAAFVPLTPPWPAGIVAITLVVEALALLVVHHRLRRAGRATVERVMLIAAAVTALAGCGYLLGSAVYVYQTPAKERLVKGFACTGDAQLLYRDKCPQLGMDELQGAEYEAERLWTLTSIATVRVGLDAAWLVAFAALATLIAGVPALAAEAPARRSTTT
jgi:hypothetical protein